jgi:hypothetical protein
VNVEDIGFHECTRGFPDDELLVQPLRHTHSVRSVISSVRGWSADRKRLNTVMYSSKYVWMGSENHDAEFQAIMADFSATNAAVFMVDDEVSVQALT